ncbi:LLM class flavin-dependent oxidoreductase [Peribacillus sp. FSL P2-0133]|uniref:LLM class flavin-dependent oxidoreductase n=1 Tax=Peribacillus sp. FSL P2-0133 TaxID=2921573 RepID=UPI0030D11534
MYKRRKNYDKENRTFSTRSPSPIVEGGSAELSLQNTLNLAKKTEQWGYKRFWLAEHHNWARMASSASPIVIGRVAFVTEEIRIGSGAMLLSHYSPLSVAEQFGTLESFFPRIDLGLGRAPGTDQYTANVLRQRVAGEPEFDARLEELIAYLYGTGTATKNGLFSFHAIPGEKTNVPIWLLGSGFYSAQLAGILGLPFSFAGHFALGNMMEAIKLYRDYFRPSQFLEEPYVLLAVQVVAADEKQEAQRLATSMYQKFLLLTRGQPSPILPPVDNMDEIWNDNERRAVEEQLFTSIIGDPAGVKQQLHELIEKTDADEIMAQAAVN